MGQKDGNLPETHPGDGGGEQHGHQAERAATQFFIASAPPGRIREVMENCELLVDPMALSERFMEETLEQTAEDQHYVITVTNPEAAPYEASHLPSELLPAASAAEIMRSFAYSLTRLLQDFSVTASPAPAEAFPAELEPYREALQRCLEKHVSQRYACSSLRLAFRVPVELSQAVSVYSHTRGDLTPPPQLTAVFSTLAQNKNSSWACSWTSEWRAYFSPSNPSAGARLEGKAEVRAFLGEDSSVQANFTRRFGLPDSAESASSATPAEVTSSEDVDNDAASPHSASVSVVVLPTANVNAPDVFARELVDAIRGNEDILIREIDEFFTNRALRIARAMRRVLPVYGKAFDWKQQSIQLQPQNLQADR
ncbi:hypothetical protein Efla_005957 [Eimeria flavescens]